MYTAATGMMAEMNRQDVVANNLANVNTIGFKADHNVSIPFEEMLLHAINKDGVKPIGTLGLGVMATSNYFDPSDGAVLETGNQTDLALFGNAFFQVDAPGGVRYTRAGNFAVNQEGYLTTQEGFQVLGENGPVQVSGNFVISENGGVFQDGEQVNQLLIMAPEGLKKEGETLLSADWAVPAENFQVLQGALEGSNVNSIRQMVEMITVTRAYEANQKALQAHDETLGKAVTELAG